MFTQHFSSNGLGLGFFFYFIYMVDVVFSVYKEPLIHILQALLIVLSPDIFFL